MYAKCSRVRVSRDGLVVAYLIAPPLSFLLSPDVPGWVAPLIPLATMLGFLLAWAWWPRLHEGRLVATACGLRCNGRLVARRSQIHSAHVRSARGAEWLHLGLKHGWVEVALDAGDQDELLRALRLDEAGIVTRYAMSCDRRASRASIARAVFLITGAPCALTVVFAVDALSHSLGWALASLAVLLGTAAAQIVMSARSWEQIWIGADGIRRRRAFGPARFEPFANVESVALERCDLVVRLRGGREIAWHGGRWRQPFPILRGLAARIERGLDAHRALVANGPALALARGARSAAEWLRDLRALGEPDRGTYRVAALPESELWATVESAAVAPTARAGAAVALQPRLDDAGRKRLRDAAATCASTELRFALEAAAGDAPLEERLAALTD